MDKKAEIILRDAFARVAESGASQNAREIMGEETPSAVKPGIKEFNDILDAARVDLIEALKGLRDRPGSKFNFEIDNDFRIITNMQQKVGNDTVPIVISLWRPVALAKKKIVPPLMRSSSIPGMGDLYLRNADDIQKAVTAVVASVIRDAGQRGLVETAGPDTAARPRSTTTKPGFGC